MDAKSRKGKAWEACARIQLSQAEQKSLEETTKREESMNGPPV
jgi:hypothetical protein